VNSGELVSSTEAWVWASVLAAIWLLASAPTVSWPSHLRVASVAGRLPLFFFFFETGFCYVAQDSLGLLILLPQPPQCWNYWFEPPRLAYLHF
jgi:hypothetical protein